MAKSDTLDHLVRRYGNKRVGTSPERPDNGLTMRERSQTRDDGPVPNDTFMLFQPGHQMGNDNFTTEAPAEEAGVPKWKAKLLQDPKYAAFLRKFDFDRDVLHDNFQALKDRQKRELARQDVTFDRDLTRNLEGVDRATDNRGMFRSGQRHLDRGTATSDMALARQRYVDEQGENREAGRRAKREGIASLKRSRSEERLGARERLSMRDAETEYM